MDLMQGMLLITILKMMMLMTMIMMTMHGDHADDADKLDESETKSCAHTRRRLWMYLETHEQHLDDEDADRTNHHT